MKEYYKNNKGKFNKEGYHKKWRKENQKKIKGYAVKGYAENKEYFKEYSKNYYKKNKEKIKKQRAKNKEKRDEYYKQYYKKHKEKEIKRICTYNKNQYHTNEEHKIKQKLRTRFGKIFKIYLKTKKIASSKKYGVDYKKILEHLKPFPRNLKDYEIHHIKPLFTFKFINQDGSINLGEIKKAFAPENHKLLTIKEHKKLNHKGIKNEQRN